MDRRWTALGLVGLLTTVAWAGQGAPLSDDDDDDGEKRSDFSLFTTEDTGEADDFVTCTAKRAAELHLTATNFDTDENRINLIFADGDLVTVRVPSGESFSMTQVIGTNPLIDDSIKIDPQDQDGDVNPMVGWASIHGEEGKAKVVCTVTTFNPIP